MDIFNIYGEIRIKLDFSASLVKDITQNLLKEYTADENYNSIEEFLLEEIIDFQPDYENSELVISLIPNSHVNYINNCIPNYSVLGLYNSIHFFLEEIIKIITAINPNIELSTSGNIEFQEDNDNKDNYNVFLLDDKKSLSLLINRKKIVNDYKRFLLSLSKGQNGGSEIEEYINNDYIILKKYRIEDLRDQ